MEQYGYHFHKGYQPAFDKVPAEHRVARFGVEATGKEIPLML